MNDLESTRSGRDVDVTAAGNGNGSSPRSGERSTHNELGEIRLHNGMLRRDLHYKRRDRNLLIVGSIAVGLWFIVFGCGTLISSRDYRLVTDTNFRERELTASSQLGQASPPLKEQQIQAVVETYKNHWWRCLAAGLISYTPINLGLLCCSAAVIAGCASNRAYSRMEQRQARTSGGDGSDGETTFQLGQQPDESQHDIKPRSDAQIYYMSEHPFEAVARSMLVYFTLLAGVYLTGANPFDGLDASGYLRYAGLVSAAAFAIAYDPSLFSELLSRIPRTGGK
jgi:hypothetical protein